MGQTIGGYFELEIGCPKHNYPHAEAFHLNSGRHALEFILRSQMQLPRSMWLPYYTCESVFEPLMRLGIEIKFYHINSRLELAESVNLGSDEMIIVNNYFGIKDRYLQNIYSLYRDKAIFDCTQAWYMPEIPGAKQFYSPRKFFGLPDGGVASTPIHHKLTLDQDYSADRCAHLLKRIDSDSVAGYMDFRKVSEAISGLQLLRMSKLTKRILGSIDHDEARQIRLRNYEELHNGLCEINQFKAPDAEHFIEGGCPMVYPFVTSDKDLRQRLIDRKIFVATYWPGMVEWVPAFSSEIEFAQNLIPLPIDQRYGIEEMGRIIKNIKG